MRRVSLMLLSEIICKHSVIFYRSLLFTELHHMGTKIRQNLEDSAFTVSQPFPRKGCTTPDGTSTTCTKSVSLGPYQNWCWSNRLPQTQPSSWCRILNYSGYLPWQWYLLSFIAQWISNWLQLRNEKWKHNLCPLWIQSAVTWTNVELP